MDAVDALKLDDAPVHTDLEKTANKLHRASKTNFFLNKTFLMNLDMIIPQYLT